MRGGDGVEGTFGGKGGEDELVGDSGNVFVALLAGVA